MGSRRNWRSICLALADEYQVFSPDQRNHGDSPHAPGMSYSELAADLGSFIRGEVGGSAHVIGHSMGGKAAMQLALTEPQCVRTLAVVDISPCAYPPRHRLTLERMLDLDLAPFKCRTQVEDALAKAIPDLAARRFLLKNLAHDAGGGLRWRVALREIYAAYAELSGAITGDGPFQKPTLFLRGERSDYLSESEMPEIRRLFPLARLEVISRAGHWVQADNPQHLLRTIREFLREQPQRGREA